jgi:hypothetical protein
MSTPATLDVFVTKHLAALFKQAGFVRNRRSFAKALRAHAHVLRYRGRPHFNVRFAITMPAYSEAAALRAHDLSNLAFGKGVWPEWRWPLIGSEEEVARSLKQALVDVGLPWCGRLLSLADLRDALQDERPSQNRARYLSLVYEQMGQNADALFWWQEYCRPERTETTLGTPARDRLNDLTVKAGHGG